MNLSEVSIRTRGSQCSCVDCDSVECFSRRFLEQICSCDSCTTRLCLYPPAFIIDKPTTVTDADFPISPIKTKASTAIEANLSKTSEIKTKSPSVLEKYFSKSLSTKSLNPSKIPISTYKISSKSCSISKGSKGFSRKNLSSSSSHAYATTKEKQKKSSSTENTNLIITVPSESRKEDQEIICKEVVYVYDRNNNTQTITTKESKVSFRHLPADNYIDEDINSMDIAKHSIKDMEFAKSSARLAAQIMNLPYEDFKSSVLESKSSELQQVSKYPIDLFKRIKEAYKACTCKVCECITGKAVTSNAICNCKPCDCYDCKHLYVNLFNAKLYPVDNGGCPCIRCDRKECKGLTGNKAQPSVCDCQIRERETKFEKGCDCEPCSCLECSMKTGRQSKIVVARFDQNSLNVCDCSPCDCADCVRSYGVSNEHQMATRHEMSTGVNRHPQCQCEACTTEACVPDGNESCWCVRHSKVMTKPFQRNTTDYDIRRAKLPFCYEPTQDKRNDTLAMYASITTSFSQKCSCDVCECLVCDYSDNRDCLNFLKKESVTNYIKNKAQEQLDSTKAKMEEEMIGEHYIKINKKQCGCDYCECLTCETRNTLKVTAKKVCSTSTCECSPCECLNAQNKIIEDGKSFYNCQDNDTAFHNQSVLHQSVQDINDPFLDIYRGYNHNVSIENPITNHFPTKDDEEPNYDKKTFYNRSSYKGNITHQQHRNPKVDIRKLAYSYKEDTEDFKELKKSPSLNSSVSCIKDDSESSSPITRNKKKSADSSCNSSGHDSPDYLIHFPKAPIHQKCIDGIMNTNFMNTECLNINYMNKPPPTAITSTSYTLNQPSFKTHVANDGNMTFNEKPNIEQLPRTSGVTAIKITSKSNKKIENDKSITDIQKPIVKNNSAVVKQKTNTVNEKETTKVKKHVTVNLMHEDLEKVRNTLTEARTFSKQLVQLVEKYENANKKIDNHFMKSKVGDPISSKSKLQSEIKHTKMPIKKDTDVGSTQYAESGNEIRLKKSTNNGSKQIQNKTQSKSCGKLLLENNQSKSCNSLRKDDDMKTAISNDNLLHEERNRNKVQLKHFVTIDVSVIITEPAHSILKTADNTKTPAKHTKTSNVKDFLNTIKEEKVCDILTDVYKGNSERKDKEQKRKRNFNYMYKRTMTKKMNIMPKLENIKLNASVLTEESKTTSQETETYININHDSKNDDLTNDTYKDNLKSPNVIEDTTSTKNLQDGRIDQVSISIDRNKNLIAIKLPENGIGHDYALHNVPSKNYQFYTGINNDYGRVYPTLTNMDFKDALHSANSIPLEPETVAPHVEEKTYQENKSLINLKSEVMKLLDMPLLQPFMGKINEICSPKKEKESPYTNCFEADITEKEDPMEPSFNSYIKPDKTESKSTRSNTDFAVKDGPRDQSFNFYSKPWPMNKFSSLKVSFVNIRQVSDDTVLLKWDPPLDSSYVKGYEVLIDGKSVQKSLNPNKCNAVVTGLPIISNDYNNKIIISIRTITNIPNIERMLATSIIYRPCIKVC